ncbi:MAG: TIM-barrel domain-containing protein [Phycisphaerales bacterium]
MQLPLVRNHSITLILLLTVAMLSSVSSAQIAQVISDGIVRFDESLEARKIRKPSFALVHNFESLGDVSLGNLKVVPEYSIDSVTGRTVASIRIDQGTSLYGTGQAAGPLLRNGFVTETWNFDAFGYGLGDSNLYTSHPWVLAVRPDGSAFGVLADTTYRCQIDLRDGITFRAEGGSFAVIVIEGGTPQEVMLGLGKLTGTIAMPPKWAVGYHQCRYSYNPDSRVREIATEFRNRKLPADVIWMDIDYMDEYRVFTFDQEQFSDPKGLNDWLDTMGFSNVWMIDPGVKDEDGYFVSDSGDEHDAWVKDQNGQVYNGEVWPGVCVFPDYLNKEVRSWWADLYEDFMAYNIDGVWNDMNEPAVFNVESKTMPETNIHNADPELGGPDTHDRYHNVYGMQMIRATRDGVMAANPDKRPFVLSRANFIGGHRYGATWTGDNSANWPHLDMSIPMSLNLSLSGQPFVGPDIGGFAYNGDGELFQRWMGFGTMFPFSRGHTAKGNIDKEPWSFGPDVEATSRRALERRYRLMPYLYTLFRESSISGMPIMRPTFFADPSDRALRSEDDSFLLGKDLLIVTKATPEADRVAVLPRGKEGHQWEAFDFPDFESGRDSKDPHLPQMFLRPGAIIATAPVTQYFGDRPDSRDELTLVINLDENRKATGGLYEDDGEGFEYLMGQYAEISFTAYENGNSVEVYVSHVEGDIEYPSRTINALVLNSDHKVVVKVK